MLENLKAFAKWVWNWITVLVVSIVGVLTEVLQYTDQLTGLDWSQVMSHERAAALMFWTAMLKMLVTIYGNIKDKAKPEQKD